MQRATKWLAVAAAGSVFGAACSSHEDRSTLPTEVTIISASPTAGAGGSGPSGEAGAGAGTAGSTVGEAGADSLASAGAGGAGGAGGADACQGEYLCPAVIYWSHALLKVDLPVSVADAADAVFTACQDGECYSAKGSAEVEPEFPSFGEDEELFSKAPWVSTGAGVVFLSFDGSGTTPFAILDWRFSYDRPAPPAGSYSLTIQPAAAAAATTLFDGDVSYAVVEADPSLVGEGFCRHCSEVVRGKVDARAGQ